MKPNRLIMLIVTGHGPYGISHNAPKKQIGMPMMTQPATFMRRNRDSNKKTSTAPIAMFPSINSSRPLR